METKHKQKSSQVLWYQFSPQEVLQKVSATIVGLTQSEVVKRRALSGYNEFQNTHKKSIHTIFLNQLKDSLAIILIVAAILSLLFGETRDATIIGIIVFMNALIGFLQEYKAEKILEQMKRLVVTKAIVTRDGEKIEIDARELVKGDIVNIGAGSRVPADMYILESYDCKVDGFIFSGESKPEKRVAKVMPQEVVPMSDIENMLFMGEGVVSGEAIGVVVATGTETELGYIADLALETREELTPLQKKMKYLGKVVAMVAIMIAVGTIALGQVMDLSWYDNFLLALALAVSIVPEGLPAAISVALALGMKRLLKHNVLAKRLSAVETLGSVSVICTDKTGTITRNELMVTRVVTAGKIFEVSGEGYIPKGDFFHDGTVVNARVIPNGDLLFRIGTLCNDASIVQNQTGQYGIAGDPTEGALLVAARKYTSDQHFFTSGEHKQYELPFSSDRMRMSVAYRNAHIQSFVKGSPDVMLELCTHYLDVTGVPQLFTAEDKQMIKKQYDALSQEALRVLAFAYRSLEGVSTQ